jgi:hypothetical protein
LPHQSTISPHESGAQAALPQAVEPPVVEFVPPPAAPPTTLLPPDPNEPPELATVELDVPPIVVVWLPPVGT